MKGHDASVLGGGPEVQTKARVLPFLRRTGRERSSRPLEPGVAKVLNNTFGISFGSLSCYFKLGATILAAC